MLRAEICLTEPSGLEGRFFQYIKRMEAKISRREAGGDPFSDLCDDQIAVGSKACLLYTSENGALFI